jgi:hypothetical protein
MTEDYRTWIRFELDRKERFEMLRRVYEALRNAKRVGNEPDAEDPYWREFFDEKALERFWWPTPEERADWARRWFATPLPQRWEDPSLKNPWDFESLIDAFFNNESELGTCERVSASEGRLYFEPLAWPYGGAECFRGLIEAFDGVVLEEHDT